jgi:hypothetical protein
MRYSTRMDPRLNHKSRLLRTPAPTRPPNSGLLAIENKITFLPAGGGDEALSKFGEWQNQPMIRLDSPRLH